METDQAKTNANLKEMEEEMMERQEAKIEANNEKPEVLRSIHVSRMDVHQARTETIQEEMYTKMNKEQEKTEAAIGSDQEELWAAINSFRVKLEESTKHRMEDVLVSLDHRTQRAQAEIETTTTLAYITQRGLEDKIAEVTNRFP
jgi:hypothetical protein